MSINAYNESAALIIHVLSFLSDIFTLVFNNNTNIKVLSVMDAGQHITKIIRIITVGFACIGSPPWFCYLHAFLNHFTHNSSLTMSCYVIFNLYAALTHPKFVTSYQEKLRPLVYLFIILYNASFTLLALYEPVFLKSYSPEFIENQHNCSSGYRHKLYQYILTSALPNMPFSLFAIYNSFVIIHKIHLIPRTTLKKQLSKNTKISFSRWLRIMSMGIIVTLFSFLNLYSDIKNGLVAERIPNHEEEKLGLTYYFTSFSGIMLFFLTNSFYQFRKKLGLSHSQTYDLQYKLPSSKPFSFNNSRNNTIGHGSSIEKVDSYKKNKNNSKSNNIHINIDNTKEDNFDNNNIHDQSNPTFIHDHNINKNTHKSENFDKNTKKYKNNNRNKNYDNEDINLLNKCKYVIPDQKNKNYYDILSNKFGDNIANKNTLIFNYNNNNNIFNKNAIQNNYIDSSNKYTNQHNYYNKFSNNEIKRYDSIKYFENLLNYHELECNDLSLRDYNKNNSAGNIQKSMNIASLHHKINNNHFNY